MSLWNTIIGNTVGTLYSARTGNVDPWTAANAKEQLAADMRQAAGPNADPGYVQGLITQAQREYDRTLVTFRAPGEGSEAGGAAPGGCSLRLPWIGCVMGEDSAGGLNALSITGSGGVGSAVRSVAENFKLIVEILVVVAVVGGTYYLGKQFGVWHDLAKALKKR
jgi:hypothetical protein